MCERLLYNLCCVHQSSTILPFPPMIRAVLKKYSHLRALMDCLASNRSSLLKISKIVVLAIIICFFFCVLAMYVISQKGNRLLKYADYYYYQCANLVHNRIRWICSSKNKPCKATIHTQNDKILCVKRGHSHPPPLRYNFKTC